MKFFLFILILSCLITSQVSPLVSARLTSILAATEDEERLSREAFEKFKEEYHKTYSSSVEEEKRYANFQANMRLLKLLQHQKEQKHGNSASSLSEQMDNQLQEGFGVTAFFDLSHEEFDGFYLKDGRQYFAERVLEEGQKDTADHESDASSPFQTLSFSSSPFSNASLPSSWDWREHGLVAPVKDQGRCGSCWAFSAIGNIEGQWAKNKGVLTRLSEQQLTSCDTVDSGCSGGLMENAFRWLIVNNSGIVYTEESYPYASENGTAPVCGANVTPVPGATIHGMAAVAQDETIIESWLVNLGPLAIAVDATVWMFYTGGILPLCLPLMLNHGVLLVGYNNDPPEPYWIIKNSWGPQWGEDGYIRIRKGINECKMSEYVVSSLVGHTPTPEPPTRTPVPPSPGKSKYVEKTCLTSECTSLCIETLSYPVDTCVKAGPGGVIVRCRMDSAEQMYFDTEDCSGTFRSATIPLSQCIAGWLTYKEATCE